MCDMTEEEFDRLIEGDIIRGKHTGQAYIVVNTMHFGKKKVYRVRYRRDSNVLDALLEKANE